MIVSARSAHAGERSDNIRLFVGWGVDCERPLAKTLSDWLALIAPSLDIKKQQRTIDSSRRWRSDVLPKLQATDRTIVCLSQESNFSTYFAFLAGLASAIHGADNVLLYLLGMGREELRGPLRRFTCFTADRKGTHKMVRALLGPRKRYTSKSMGVHWPVLEKELAGILQSLKKPDCWEGLDAIDREILISGLGG